MKLLAKFVFTGFFVLLFGSLAQAEVVTDTIDNSVDQINCAAITHNLILGSRDSLTDGDVSTLQIYLSQANYLESDPTGFFGRLTKKAVQDFQKANSITPIGNVGPITRAKIQSLSCGNTSSTTISTTNSGGNQSSSSFVSFTSPLSGDVVDPSVPVQIKWRFDDPSLTQNYNAEKTYVVLKVISSEGKTVGLIGDGYLLSTTTASWDIKKYQEQGFYSLTLGGKYKIRAKLSYQPKFICDPSYPAGRTDCTPLYSDTDKALMNKANQYQSDSGWFVVGQKNISTEDFSVSKDGSTVTIKGPSTLLSKIDGCRYSQGFNGPSGNGLTVDWGDGKIEPNSTLLSSSVSIGSSCSSVVKSHTYSAGGNYVITVTLWHSGPTDAPIIDWKGTQSVSIANGVVRDQVVTPQGPSIPQNLSSSNVSKTSATISWSASSVIGGPSLAGYKVYRGSVLVATLGTVTTYTDTGLSAGNNYSYTVSAFDTAGNTSQPSSALLVATQEGGILSGTPSGANSVSFSSVSGSVGNQATVSWQMTGTTYEKDWIGIVPKGTSWKGANLQQIWFYTKGATLGSQKIYLPASTGDYDAVYYRNDSVTDEVMRSATAINVSGSTPYDFVLSTGHTRIKAGDGIVVYWKANAGTASSEDWLALVPTGTSWQTGLPWVYTGGSSLGGVTLATQSSLSSGTYDLVYYTTGRVKKFTNPIAIEVAANPVSVQQNGYGYGTYNQTANVGSLINMFKN